MKKFESKEISIDGFDVIELFSENQSAFIALDIGNTLYHWTWEGKSLLWFPYSLESYLASEKLAGNPLMYPWANRLATDGFSFEGHHYPLISNSMYRDGNGAPLHGLLLKSGRWTTKETGSDHQAAWHTAEYHCTEHSEIFAQFPFEHHLEMTHRLDNDGIQITINIINHDDKSIPLSFGFHPYFSLENNERSKIKVSIPYDYHVVTDKFLLPTGILEPIEKVVPNAPFQLGKYFLDDGFVSRIAGQHPYIETDDYRLEVVFDDQYACCVMYAPVAEGKNYICIEPMLVPTNSLQKIISDIHIPFVPPHSSRDFTFKMKVSAKYNDEEF